MLNLQRVVRCAIGNVFKTNFCSSIEATSKVRPMSIKVEAAKKDESSIQLQAQKSPMVAKVFASLKEEEASDTDKSNVPPTPDVVDERIINAKTVNGLLSISETNGTLSRKHALKIVSILAEWSSINRTKLSDFENDARFVKLCRTLGRTGGKNYGATVKNGNGGPKKVTGFRTDDLNTVLGVTGDDEAAKLISSITLPQMVKVMSALAQKKRRSTPLLRSLAFNISGSSEELNMKQCADVLFSMAVLNFSDPVLISRICNDVQVGLTSNDDKSAVVGSILTSLGILKYRDADCMEALSNWVMSHQDICRPQDLTALFLTLATVNYSPANAQELKTKSVATLNETDLAKTNDWLNHVWSLVVLSMASNDHIQSVLKKDFIEKLVTERQGSISPSLKMKLLNINAAGKYLTTESPYTGPLLAAESGVFEVPFSHNKSKQVLVNGMLDALKSLMSSEVYVKTHVDSKMGFVIDAECMFDTKGNPLPVDKPHPEGKRIAILVQDYHDMVQGTHQTINGITALSIRLLERSGYHVLTVPYNEFSVSDKVLKRVQYLEVKLKEIVNNSSKKGNTTAN